MASKVSRTLGLSSDSIAASDMEFSMSSSSMSESAIAASTAGSVPPLPGGDLKGVGPAGAAGGAAATGGGAAIGSLSPSASAVGASPSARTAPPATALASGPA